MALTGDVIRQALTEIDNPKDFADKLAQAIVNHIEIKIPVGAVVVSATGGVNNATEIPCEVK